MKKFHSYGNTGPGGMEEGYWYEEDGIYPAVRNFLEQVSRENILFSKELTYFINQMKHHVEES